MPWPSIFCSYPSRINYVIKHNIERQALTRENSILIYGYIEREIQLLFLNSSNLKITKYVYFLTDNKKNLLWAETFYAKSQSRVEFYGRVIKVKNMGL